MRIAWKRPCVWYLVCCKQPLTYMAIASAIYTVVPDILVADSMHILTKRRPDQKTVIMPARASRSSKSSDVI